MAELVRGMYVLVMVAIGTALLFESGLTTPLGSIRLIGTASGASVNRGRVMSEYALVYSVAGEADYRDELGNTQVVSPGAAMIVFPGLRHWYGARPGTSWDQIYFVFDGPMFHLLEMQGLFDRSAPITQVEPVADWAERYLAFAGRPRPMTQTDAMIMVGDFVQLLLASLARSSLRTSWLTRARSLIDNTVTRPADFEQIAAELDVSYETFRKRFRKEAGEPPARYRNRRRIAIARDLLTSTSLSLRQIAATLGYTDEFHLSKRFKAEVGLSPREYRNREDSGKDGRYPPAARIGHTEDS